MNVGFLGLGKMARALAVPLAKSGQAKAVFFYDILPNSKLAGLSKCQSSQELENSCDILILCVKPQDMQKALETLRGNKKYISIAAGIGLSSLQSFLRDAEMKNLARVMPNMAALVSQSANAVYCENDELFLDVQRIFSLCGIVLRLPKEEDMHAVTALSGSGPALVADFLEGLVRGGRAAGLAQERRHY